MDKQFLDAVDMLKIAANHAYCAEYLLKQNALVKLDHQLTIDALLPITSLMYLAFELTLKAYLFHDHHHVKQYKTLFELIELNEKLGLSKQDIELVSTLARQQAFRKGTEYTLWDDRQQQHVFCVQIMELYERLQLMMPLELQADYQ